MEPVVEPELALSIYKNDSIPIMDLRSTSEFYAKRVKGSAHVPPDDFSSRCCWLPDKTARFGVVVSADDMHVQDCTNVKDFLRTRFWTNVVFYLKDSRELWQAAEDLGLLEGPEVSPEDLHRRFLFRPCPLVEDEINRIERTAAEAALAASASGSGCIADTPHLSVSSALQLRCLEPGCGSARNMAWLAARRRKITLNTSNVGSGSGPHSVSDSAPSIAATGSSSVEQPAEDAQPVPGLTGNSAEDAACSGAAREVQVSWSTEGFDFWYGALVRSQDLFQYAGIPPEQAVLYFAEMDPATAALKPLAVSQTCKHSVTEHTHIVVPSPTQLPGDYYDLILCVRFLERSFLRDVPGLLRKGGFLLYSTFLDMEGTRAFGRPKGDNHLLKPGELAAMFGPEQGFQVLRDEYAVISDGREVSMFVARKLP